MSSTQHLSLLLSPAAFPAAGLSLLPPLFPQPTVLILKLPAPWPPLPLPLRCSRHPLGHQPLTPTATHETGGGRCPFHSLEGQGPSLPAGPHPRQDLFLQKPLFADSSSPRWVTGSFLPHKDCQPATRHDSEFPETEA